MLTPQQIQEVGFDRAVFGGYDMKSVDDFLEPLTEDYINLYKENAVLKSKMRVLVEKLEEYRKQEASMKNAIVAAQKTSDDMVAEAQRKCARMINEAEAAARAKAGNVDVAVDAERERLNRAKAAASDFIETMEAELHRQLDDLGSLKMMDLTQQKKEQPPMVIKRAFDYESDPDVKSSEAKPAPTPDADDIASEIQQSLDKIVGTDDDLGDTKVLEPLRPVKNSKFADLQFGKNYDPTRK